MLVELSHEELEELGVSALGHRKKVRITFPLRVSFCAPRWQATSCVLTVARFPYEMFDCIVCCWQVLQKAAAHRSGARASKQSSERAGASAESSQKDILETEVQTERVTVSPHNMGLLGIVSSRATVHRPSTSTHDPDAKSQQAARAAALRYSASRLVAPYARSMDEKQYKEHEANAGSLLLKQSKNETLSAAEVQSLQAWTDRQTSILADKEKKKTESAASRDKTIKGGGTKSLEALFYAGGSLDNIKAQVAVTQCPFGGG